MQKHAKALPLYERSLAVLRAKLGLDHFNTGLNFHNLAGMHQAMGKHAKAQTLYERSLAIIIY